MQRAVPNIKGRGGDRTQQGSYQGEEFEEMPWLTT